MGRPDRPVKYHGDSLQRARLWSVASKTNLAVTLIMNDVSQLDKFSTAIHRALEQSGEQDWRLKRSTQLGQLARTLEPLEASGAADTSPCLQICRHTTEPPLMPQQVLSR